MTTEEIRKMAEEYVAKVYGGDTDFIDEAENVISWFLSTHCIVKKNNVSNVEEVTIDGWVARDEDGKAYLHSIRPERGFDDDRNVGVWGNCVGHQMIALKRIFPSLTWESEPLEVTITIKPKKI